MIHKDVVQNFMKQWIQHRKEIKKFIYKHMEKKLPSLSKAF